MTPVTNDHDLLVRLDTKLDALTASFSDVKAAVATKADADRVAKLETEVAGLRNKVLAAGGALAALQVMMQVALRFAKV